MKRINDIVSDAIDVRINDDNKDKTFDISKIDFERLRAEFMRRKHQNLLLRDLQQLIEGRLAEMMARNPTRIDYYERYQTIISNYNAEQNRAAIEKSFTDLLALANELDIETERYIREGFDNEEQLALFDLLKKDTLSKEEIKMLKASAKELLNTIRKAIANMNNWREKETTRAEMAKIIRDTLWHSLPTSYTDADMTNCRQKIYTFVVERSCFHDERNTGQQAILSLAAPLLLCLCAMLFLFSAETANPCKHNHRNRHEIHHINRDFPPCRTIVFPMLDEESGKREY